MKTSKRTKVAFCVYCVLVLVTVFAIGAYASEGNDPLTVVNNLSNFSAPVSGR